MLRKTRISKDRINLREIPPFMRYGMEDEEIPAAVWGHEL